MIDYGEIICNKSFCKSVISHGEIGEFSMMTN